MISLINKMKGFTFYARVRADPLVDPPAELLVQGVAQVPEQRRERAHDRRDRNQERARAQPQLDVLVDAVLEQRLAQLEVLEEGVAEGAGVEDHEAHQLDEVLVPHKVDDQPVHEQLRRHEEQQVDGDAAVQLRAERLQEHAGHVRLQHDDDDRLHRHGHDREPPVPRELRDARELLFFYDDEMNLSNSNKKERHLRVDASRGSRKIQRRMSTEWHLAPPRFCTAINV
jgi:hypothetical protein